MEENHSLSYIMAWQFKCVNGRKYSVADIMAWQFKSVNGIFFYSTLRLGSNSIACYLLWSRLINFLSNWKEYDLAVNLLLIKNQTEFIWCIIKSKLSVLSHSVQCARKLKSSSLSMYPSFARGAWPWATPRIMHNVYIF